MPNLEVLEEALALGGRTDADAMVTGQKLIEDAQFLPKQLAKYFGEVMSAVAPGEKFEYREFYTPERETPFGRRSW